MPSGVVAKHESSRNVVETGIRSRVISSRKMGAATCKNVNVAGVSENPFEASRP